MKNQTETIHSAKTLLKQYVPTKSHAKKRISLMAAMLTLPLLLTACNNNNQTAKDKQIEPSMAPQDATDNQHQSAHNKSGSHDEHANHAHEDHAHEDHDHEEHHNHATGFEKKQNIPQGYDVNLSVSNYPMYLLSEAVTQNTNSTAYRLLGAGDVGHHGSLTPSDMKTLRESKYVVWFGKTLETNLSNSLKNNSNVITMLDTQALSLLESRDEKGKVIKGKIDPHVWLDPNNAKVIVNQLAKLHAEVNPQLATQYQKNAQDFATAMDALVAKYQSQRTEKKQYWSSHDAFQYIEKSLNIEMAGALTTDHEIPAKASQIIWLKKNRPNKTMCLLSQGVQKQGTIDKLNPVISTVLIEDMSNSKSFAEGWDKLASKVVECVSTS